jgi:hypothetical protein
MSDLTNCDTCRIELEQTDEFSKFCSLCETIHFKLEDPFSVNKKSIETPLREDLLKEVQCIETEISNLYKLGSEQEWPLFLTTKLLELDKKRFFLLEKLGNMSNKNKSTESFYQNSVELIQEKLNRATQEMNELSTQVTFISNRLEVAMANVQSFTECLKILKSPSEKKDAF